MQLSETHPRGIAETFLANADLRPDTSEVSPGEFFEGRLSGGNQKARISYASMRHLRAALAGERGDVVGLVWGSMTSRGPCVERFEPLPSDSDWLPESVALFLDALGDLPSPIGFFRVQLVGDSQAHPADRAAFSETAGSLTHLPAPFRNTAPTRPFTCHEPLTGSAKNDSVLGMVGTDCELVRRYLPRLPHNRGVFLVIQDTGSSSSSAALYTLDANWTPARKAPALVFPFGEYALTHRPQDWRVPAPRPRFEPEPDPVISDRLEALWAGL